MDMNPSLLVETPVCCTILSIFQLFFLFCFFYFTCLINLPFDLLWTSCPSEDGAG